jgi:hypothetical protein
VPAAARAAGLLAAAIGLALASVAAVAEEGGTGHYLPGSIASFIDGVAAKESFALRLNVVNYDGSVGKTQPLPIASLTTAGADAKSTGVGLTMFWRPAVEVGEGWSYAMSATVPYVWLDVSADVTALGITASRKSSVSGLGDVVLMPLMLNQNIDPDFNINYRVALYAPTGSYEVGRLANTGKNFWTLEPTVGFMYFGQKNGIEASVFVGADFNRTNSETDYKSGTQVHVDGTFAQHFPWQAGLVGLGLNGYYYQQVTGDSGSGATLGDFKGKTFGIGPVASLVTKVGGRDLIAELKWVHETSTTNRLQGDLAWLKVLYKFY